MVDILLKTECRSASRLKLENRGNRGETSSKARAPKLGSYRMRQIPGPASVIFTRLRTGSVAGKFFLYLNFKRSIGSK